MKMTQLEKELEMCKDLNKIEKETKFKICDYFLRSYLDCINTYSEKHPDCVQIGNTFAKNGFCNIKISP
jgi:hypothetical protein